MPSSTSNSDIPYRDVPDKAWGGIIIAALVITLICVIAWESLARSMQHMPGTFQSGFGEMWADERRKLDDSDNEIRVVLLGSSRMQWNADLDIIEDAFGTRPLQLALAGTSPVLMIEDVIENTDFDGLMLIGFSSFLFSSPFAENDLEDWGYYGAPAKEWYDGVSPSRRSGRAIHDFLSLYFGFLDSAFSLQELKDHYIELPVREGAEDPRLAGWKLGDIYTDRQTDMWPPVEDTSSFDNEQVEIFWDLPGQDHDPDETREHAEKIVEFFAPLIEKLRASDGDMVFIRMPVSGLYLAGDEKNQMKESLWNPMQEGMDALFIDAMDYPDLMAGLETPEWSHLNRASQDAFSRRIVPLIEAEYTTLRGHSIFEVTNSSEIKK